jgi:hypothetical protein
MVNYYKLEIRKANKDWLLIFTFVSIIVFSFKLQSNERDSKSITKLFKSIVHFDVV